MTSDICFCCLCYAGYTPEDNWADFSLLTTIPRQYPDYVGGSKDYLLLRMSEAPQLLIVNIQHVEYLRSEILLCWWTPRTNARSIFRLSREAKLYPNRKRADRRRKHNKHSHGTAQKRFGHYHCRRVGFVLSQI